MTSARSTPTDHLAAVASAVAGVDGESRTAAIVRRAVVAPARVVGFWLAVALPFCYLPLIAGGLSVADVETFGTLLALNVAGLVLGRGYGRAPTRD